MQLQLYFREQFATSLQAEPDLTPYEHAFCSYFGNRAVDDQLARSVAPALVYFHLSVGRLLRGQLRLAWHRSTCGLVDPGPAFPPGLRLRGYCALTSHLWSSLGVVALCLLAPVERMGSPGLGAVIVGFLVGVLGPSPAHVLARLVWYDPEDPDLMLQVALGQTAQQDPTLRRSRGVPVLVSLVVFALSLVLLILLIGYTDNSEAANLQLSVAAVTLVLVRLVLWPLARGFFLTWVVASSKRSRAFDWLLWYMPLAITAHDATF